MINAADRGNITLPKFRYTLQSSLGTVNCRIAPQEYENIKLELNRDMFFAGVFQELKVNQLTFLGDDEKKLLKALHTQDELFAECNLIVSYLDMTTREYVAYPNSYKLDFDKYKEILYDVSVNAIRINTKSTSFAKKISDNKNKVVDLTDEVALNGYQIVPYTALKKNNNVGAINVNFEGKFLDPSFPSTDTLAFGEKAIVLSTILSSDFNELVSQSQQIIPYLSDPDNTDAIFKNSEESRDLTLEGTFLFRATVTEVLGSFPEVELRLAIIDTDGSTIASDTLLETFDMENPIIDGTTYRVIVDEDFSITTDQSIVVYIYHVITANLTPITDFQARTTGQTITEQVVSTSSSTVEGFPAYEAMERCLQHVLGVQFPLFSEFLGRVDVVYNADGDMYLTEDQERFVHVTNGLSVRGLSMDDPSNSIGVTLEDMFKSFYVLWNIGLGLDVIDGQDKVVIEEREAFFIDSVGVDLSSRIQDLQIEKETLSELAYSEIKAGYENFDYEVTNGIGEYNTRNIRSSVIPNNKSIDLISPFRADTRGLTKALQQPVIPNDITDAFGTTDLESDKHIFMIKTQRDSSEWKFETNENIQVLDNSSLFGDDSSFNLFGTPTRMTRRHGFELASGLEGKKNSVLKFQASDKLANLRTTDGADDVSENEDILVNDIMPPKWKAAQRIVRNVQFFESDLQDFFDNKNKLFKLSDTVEGWIKKISINIYDKTMDLHLLEKA